jgi:uncharacterized OB-fold protein
MRDEDFFWTGVDEGRLVAQKCTGCGTLRHPPSPMCANCQSLGWAPQILSGRGRIFSWLISRHPTKPDAAPRTVILVDLEEGPRMVSNLQGEGAPEIGAAVELFFAYVGGARLPQFRIAAQAAR